MNRAFKRVWMRILRMFGYPGGAILPVFDQLYRTPAKFILNRHEQASGHCADGYYRATGKPGVCIVKRGDDLRGRSGLRSLLNRRVDRIGVARNIGRVVSRR